MGNGTSDGSTDNDIASDGGRNGDDRDSLISEDAASIMEQLDGVEHKIGELRQERDRLVDANDMLVELVQELEKKVASLEQERSTMQDKDEQDMDSEQTTHIEVQDYHYSFGTGWEPKKEVSTEDREPDLGEDIHPERLVLDPDVDAEAIREQIGQVRYELKRLKIADES